MIHIGFTIDVDNNAHIVIKDGQRRVIHRRQIPLGESSGETAEWLTCKAAIREAGGLGAQAIRLYSDCQVIDRLNNRDPAYKPAELVWPTGYGHADLSHYFDALSLLWRLFNGKWEAIRIEKERILNENNRTD